MEKATSPRSGASSHSDEAAASSEATTSVPAARFPDDSQPELDLGLDFGSGQETLPSPATSFSANALDLIQIPPASVNDKRRHITVFATADIDGLDSSKGALGSNDDHLTRLRATVRHLKASGGRRVLIEPPADWEQKLERLVERFPNFRSVVEDAIAPSLAIAAQGGYVRPPPVLLVGPAGCGKSYFAQCIADFLAVPLFKQDMASATMSCTLSGSAPHWGNSAPGAIFKMLAFGRGAANAVANPCFFLDEIDKVGGDHRYDPLAPLYALLEMESAKHFEDEALPGLPMDASHIRWLATANDASRIPAPILSRLCVFAIEMPNITEYNTLISEIFALTVDNSGLAHFSRDLPRGIESIFGQPDPRQFKTRCAIAIGKAIRARRQHVLSEDFALPPIKAPRKIGFT